MHLMEEESVGCHFVFHGIERKWIVVFVVVGFKLIIVIYNCNYIYYYFILIPEPM